MGIYEDDNLEVKPSPIEGYGLFAKRDFTEGETVVRWHPKVLSEVEVNSVSGNEKRYINTLDDGKKVLMGIPERYVNHADAPNTCTKGQSDVAIRDIRAGEEITSSYDFDS